MSDLTWLTTRELADLLARGEVSSVEAVTAHRPPEVWLDFDAIGDVEHGEAEAAAVAHGLRRREPSPQLSKPTVSRSRLAALRLRAISMRSGWKFQV